MPIFRKKPIEIEAHQWFKNGDHPEDTTETFEEGEFKGQRFEGTVVRYFRHPDISGEKQCQHCGNIMHDHGWIDTLEGGHIVCPGDWVITGIENERYPCKPHIFEQTYEPVEQQPAVEPYEVLFSVAMNTAKQAMDYVQSNPDKFDARLGDDKLAIVCREFLKAQQPTPDVGVLVEALEQVIKAAPSNGPLWYGSEQIAEARAALTAFCKEGEQPASSHDWDGQDKCRRCGDRDWYASATCTPKY